MGVSGPSLLIESTDSMIIYCFTVKHCKYYGTVAKCYEYALCCISVKFYYSKREAVYYSQTR